jgi:hypothetical protein
MSEKKTQQQQNDKKHRKLVRSPEKLSPCDLDPLFNPSFLSSSTNIFAAIQSSSRSSPTKSYNDQFPPQQVWLNSNLPLNVDHSTTSCASSSLPFSSSTPSIAFYRKPSITIKYSRDEGSKSEASSHGHQSSLAHQQQISKSIDSNHPFTKTISTTEHADQMSNNFLINFENVPGCLHHNHMKSSPKQQHQEKFEQPSMSLYGFNDETSSSNLMSACDIYQQQHQQQQQVFAHSPTSQSLNLNLINLIHNESNACKNITAGQIVLNKNNPFLNDTFDAITTHEDEGGGGKIDTSFFNIDDSNESDMLFFAEESSKKASDEMEEQLLKNKREKFSNASTMNISPFLVVSPPNKLFQVSITFVDGSQCSKISSRSWVLKLNYRFIIDMPNCYDSEMVSYTNWKSNIEKFHIAFSSTGIFIIYLQLLHSHLISFSIEL